MAQLPVIYPHALIEADLMLAGVKPSANMNIYPDNFTFKSIIEYHEHLSTKRLDQGVKEGKLVSADIAINPDNHNGVSILREYGQCDKENEVKRNAAHLQFIYDRDGGFKNQNIDELGRIYGYRRRDCWLFKQVKSPKSNLTEFAKATLSALSAMGQPSYTAQMIKRSGQSPDAWFETMNTSIEEFISHQCY